MPGPRLSYCKLGFHTQGTAVCSTYETLSDSVLPNTVLTTDAKQPCPLTNDVRLKYNPSTTLLTIICNHNPSLLVHITLPWINTQSYTYCLSAILTILAVYSIVLVCIVTLRTITIIVCRAIYLLFSLL